MFSFAENLDLMTKEDIIDLLYNPDKTGDNVDDLKLMVKKYPYFHTVHQLFIKGLQQTNCWEMELRLTNTALSVRNRSLLYDYLNDSDVFQMRFQKNLYIAPKSETQISIFEANKEKPCEKVVAEKTEKKEIIEAPPVKTEKVEVKKVEKKTEKVEVKQKTVNKSTDKLIDAFLKSNPKIVPGDTKFEVNLSESLQDVTDIGTETLADIYATQGEKDRAIEIYEQLILKIPEKNIYFAAQIKRLKEDLNNNNN